MSKGFRDSRGRTAPLARGRQVQLIAVLVVLSGAVALALGEALLRVIPIPGIDYHTYYFDDRTGGKYYPHTTAMYRNARGDFVKRRVNAWGFADEEHEMTPAAGVLRIGFFGDSYTEARQVPLEATFVRLIEDGLNERASLLSGVVNGRGEPVTRVETINFGMSGRSTLQSFLEYQQWVERAHLDAVVYVFCENDPGDQVEEIKRADTIPYAYLAGDSFRVDYSFAERYGYKNSRLHRIWQFMKSHSLVLSTLEGRIKLLKRHGIKMKVTAEDREGGRGTAGPRGVEPSSWPSDSLAAQGWELFTRVLDAWRRDASRRGLYACVTPIPREKEVGKPIGEQDAWAARVGSWCAARRMAFVDPNSAFAAAKAEGFELYYDHFTADGHRVFAAAFVRQTGEWLAPRAAE